MNQKSLTNVSWRGLYLSRAKLKASSTTSALLSGFAMVGMVEIDIQNDIHEGILIAFSVVTTLVVSVHLLALMISTCILPNLDVVISLSTDVALRESPHDRMRWFIEMAWMFSTCLGIVLFLAQMALMSWVRFHALSTTAAITSTVIIVPALVIFLIFGGLFYRHLVSHKYKVTTRGLEELESMAHDLDVADVTGKMPSRDSRSSFGHVENGVHSV